MSGFANQVIGGLTKLIRDAINSPNFVHNVSGWSINKDGSAEFNDVEARGNITANELVVPTGATVGARIVIDSAGLTAYSAANNIVLFIPVNPNPTALFTDIIAGLTANSGVLTFSGGLTTLNPDPTNANGVEYVFDNGQLQLFSNISPGPDRFKFGVNGVVGGACYEEANLVGQVVASSTLFGSLNNPTLPPAAQATDYPSGWSGSIWTAPASGQYTITFSVAFNAWVAASTLAMQVLRNGTAATNVIAQKNDMEAAGSNNVTLTKYIVAGDTLQFRLYQNTLVNQTITVGERSYISIKRIM